MRQAKNQCAPDVPRGQFWLRHFQDLCYNGAKTQPLQNTALLHSERPKLYRVTGCRFVQLADSYTWSFQAYTSFTVSIKDKLITQAIKQATISTIFSAHVRVACRFQSMQTIIFNYQCDSVSSMAIKFQNHAAASQHSLPILITDGEKIIVLYTTFTYICSQRQKYLQIFIVSAEVSSLSILFNSITFKIAYANSLYQLF